MATSGFDTYYGDHPWAGITTKTRTWYVPDLLAAFRARSLFRQFVPQQVSLLQQATNQMTFTLMYDLEPTIDSIGDRDLWLTAGHTDSASVTITMQHYGGKVALHKFDDYITYWRKAGMNGLRQIVRGLLGPQMTDTLDILARNAFLDGPFAFYAGDASNDGFNDLDSTSDDIFKIGMLQKLWLGMSYRHLPLAQGPEGPTGAMVIITTPGVIYDIRAASGSDWVSLQQYNTNIVRLPYEVGSVYGCRFLQTPLATLWNHGVQSKVAHVLSSISAGDGAYATVDEVYSVGQSGATNYVQIGSGDAASFSVNDIVTICTTRVSTHGVTNEPSWASEKTCYRRLVNVDTVNDRLSFDKPLLQDYTTDLGGGVYAYVVKGKHIHASIALGGPNGVVAGVSQSPQVHVPPTVDDIMAIFRFSWDAYLKYQRFRPEVFETVYSLGSTRVKGGVAFGG